MNESVGKTPTNAGNRPTWPRTLLRQRTNFVRQGQTHERMTRERNELARPIKDALIRSGDTQKNDERHSRTYEPRSARALKN